MNPKIKGDESTTASWGMRNQKETSARLADGGDSGGGALDQVQGKFNVLQGAVRFVHAAQ
jgi:hypothetical protein